MSDKEEDARTRAEMIDLHLRGTFLNPFSGLFTALYVACVIYLLWYLLLSILPVAVDDVLSAPGVLLGLSFLLVAIFAPRLPIIPFLIVPLIEYFVFERSPLEISWINIFGTVTLGAYGIVFTHWAMSRLGQLRGERPIPLFGENPMVKKELFEQEIQRSTPGMSAVSLVSTTCGWVFALTILYVMSSDPESRWIPIEFLLPFITITPPAFTLASGLRLVYSQSEASVGSAIKWIMVYFGFIVFGFTWIYWGVYPRSGGEICLNVPEYLNLHAYDHTLNALYFSVVTFTTLGYGDIQPMGWCRLVAASQALCGILFTPLFVAFLFGVISRHAGPR